MSLFESDTERCIILLHPTVDKFQSKEMEQAIMGHKLDMDMACQALELSPFGVCITGSNGELIYGNKTLFQIFQIPPEKQTTEWNALTSIKEAIRKNEPYIEIDSPSNGKTHTIKCWHHPSEHRDGANTYFFLDVTEKKALFTEKTLLEDELSRLNTRDALTGLPNKSALLQGLEPLVSRSRRYNNPLTVIHLAVDIQDASDHDDALLKLSHMLRDQMRWADMIGRLEEDKFLLILPETPEDAANTLTNKLSDKIAELNNHHNMKINVFFGMANWGTGDDARLMLKRAAEDASKKRTSSSVA